MNGKLNLNEFILYFYFIFLKKNALFDAERIMKGLYLHQFYPKDIPILF